MAYRKINVSEFIGKRYGRLRIIGRSLIGGKKGKGYAWDCICDCGRKIQVPGGHLYGPWQARTKSCGCLHDENSRRFRAPGETGALKLFRSYKDNAVRRKIEFNLTFEEFKNLTSKNCTYCGTPPVKKSIKNNCRTEYGLYYYNGIDRVDPKKGYQLDNSVPCCHSCNTIKMNQSRIDFLKRIALIYRRHEKEISQFNDLSNCGQPEHDYAQKILKLEIAFRKFKNKTDSIFYALKNIARIKYRDKEFILTTSGGYRFIYTDSMGKKHHGNDFSSVLKKWTDEDINRLRLSDSIRNWGRFTIVLWTRATEEQSSLETFPIDSNYDEAMQTFIKFVKEKTGITDLEEEDRSQRNTAQRLLRGHSGPSSKSLFEF